ncbi:MAG: transporter [Flavisolibacter sp.]|jgi:lipopolysaccharide transport system ATP-binding protein|nr:transporter [Flavisolibacter sp.]
MEPAIIIENLSKQFKKGATNAPYLSLRDVITKAFQKKTKNEAESLFWALKDINLQIEPGERIGIIGRNGAGKSTLLKIISRITPPTKGRVIFEGRVASLLEVGTGFHPELTGRENIYLNGSILGLQKAEITKKLDEIIDFSGVENFIDTPLKHYSSGMELRLAFSVAAHLEPEILLIDEVLAVGDIEFQKKCLGKMEEVSQKEGRTILFVSHNLEAVLKLCDKGLWLKSGKVKMYDDIDKVVSAYIDDSNEEATFKYAGKNDFSKAICILEGWIKASNTIPNMVEVGEPLIIQMKIAVNEIKKFSFEVLIRDSRREPLLFLPVGLAHGKEHTLSKGEYVVTITTMLPFLTKDRYFIDLITADTNKSYIHYLESAVYFEMGGKVLESTNFEYTANQRMGKILLTEAIKVEINEL